MGIPTIAETKRARVYLEQAYDLGLAKMTNFAPECWSWRPPTVAPHIRDRIARLPDRRQRLDQLTDQLGEPARDTRAQLYKDTGYAWDGPLTNWMCYELARFVAGPEELGIVKYCSTWVEVMTTDPPIYVPTDPGDPYALQRRDIYPIFFLRYYQGTFQDLGPQESGYPFEIRGYGYHPLPYWYDNRFKWGRTAADVFWLVPSNHALRLYVCLANVGHATRLLGRLKGYTQPAGTLPAARNVLYGW